MVARRMALDNTSTLEGAREDICLMCEGLQKKVRNRQIVSGLPIGGRQSLQRLL